MKRFADVKSVQMYCDGLREGVRRYAHWRNGTQYVGTCGTTLEEALNDISFEEVQILKTIEIERV